MLGFLTTGVGLPLLGITAIALQGGRYLELINSRMYPWFATALLVVLYLCIGPVFAVPRTGAVSFEIGIRPFLQEDSLKIGQAVYTALFFGASYYLSLNPNKLIDRVGKMLTRRSRRASRTATSQWTSWPQWPSARSSSMPCACAA